MTVLSPCNHSVLDTQVSEGLDFSDRAGRAVVITGIPYAVKTDPKVSCETAAVQPHPINIFASPIDAVLCRSGSSLICWTRVLHVHAE